MIRIRHASDSMLLVEFEARIDPQVNEQAIRLAAALERRHCAGVVDVVASYCTVGVHFDPLRTDLVALEDVIDEAAGTPHASPVPSPQPIVEIPVRYGGEDGVDLEAVARFARCSPGEVVSRHAAEIYRVYMVGFVPGFAYMGRVSASIAAPRHHVPRERVPAGSVGIAGEQTGVYPITSPGGWQIVGRTDVRMFDTDREPASLLRPGDRVRFVPVSTS